MLVAYFWFMLGLLLDSEDGDDNVRRNIGRLLPNYTTLQRRNWYSSQSQL
jgi:hypothetical protein